MWVAKMNTEHFEWLALGRTKKQAKAAIAEKWNEGDGLGRTKMDLEELTEYYGIRLHQLKSGQCIFQ